VKPALGGGGKKEKIDKATSALHTYSKKGGRQCRGRAFAEGREKGIWLKEGGRLRTCPSSGGGRKGRADFLSLPLLLRDANGIKKEKGENPVSNKGEKRGDARLGTVSILLISLRTGKGKRRRRE